MSFFCLKTGLSIFGLFEDSSKEYLLRGTLNLGSESSQGANVWFSSYGSSVPVFLIIYEPYVNVNVTLALHPTNCKIITVKPCYDIIETEKRIKQYGVPVDPTNIWDLYFKINEWHIKDYLDISNYFKFDELIRKSDKYSATPKFKRTKHFSYKIDLNGTNCLRVQILPELIKSNINVSVLNFAKKFYSQTETRELFCQHHIAITSSNNLIPRAMNIQGTT